MRALVIVAAQLAYEKHSSAGCKHRRVYTTMPIVNLEGDLMVNTWRQRVARVRPIESLMRVIDCGSSDDPDPLQ